MTWARLGRACILAVVLVGLGPVGDASAEPGVVAVIGDNAYAGSAAPASPECPVASMATVNACFPAAGSVRRDAEHHGALFLRATSRSLTGEFRSAGGLLVDRVTLIQPAARPARHPEATAR
ncbi:MAG: hypothetical protein KGP12_09105 [Actinomycetales bacterium]|nr:hypothetical protein [Actinomycetales bacterium]